MSLTEIDDDRNPDFIFQLTHTDLLVQALRGEIDLLALARKEMIDRGMGRNGEWVGFQKAAEIWEVE